MSDRFSIRNELQKFSNQNDCNKTTRTRLWQAFAKQFVLTKNNNSIQYDIVEDTLSYFGQEYKMEYNPFDHKDNVNKLNQYIINCEWYKVYDFIEFVLAKSINTKEHIYLNEEFNLILEDEKTGYHIISGLVASITNPIEIIEIEKAMDICPEHVSISIRKAIKLFSDKNKPDYNNAIKEMITAVEALCCTIVKDEGIDNADTLGKAINKFKECGIALHEKLISSIKDLYKYTCNEDGKRHGGTTFVESDVEDARFMIVTCSAILNLLMVKWEKSKEEHINV